MFIACALYREEEERPRRQNWGGGWGKGERGRGVGVSEAKLMKDLGVTRICYLLILRYGISTSKVRNLKKPTDSTGI